LFHRKVNILLIPDETKRVRQVRVSWALLALFSFLVISWAVCIFWIAGNYLVVRSQMSQLAQLEIEDKLWQKRLLSFDQQSDEMTKILKRLSGQTMSIEHLSNYARNSHDSYNPFWTKFQSPKAMTFRHIAIR
jgi:hypothetical protein